VVASPESVASISPMNGLTRDSAYMMDHGTEYTDAVLATGFLIVMRQFDYDMSHCWSGSWYHSYRVLYEHYECCLAIQ